MNTKDLACHDGSNWELSGLFSMISSKADCVTYSVESIDEGLPDLRIASSLTLIIKSVHSCYIGTFVVAPQQKEILGIFDLVTHEEEHRFQRILSSVHIVSQE